LQIAPAGNLNPRRACREADLSLLGHTWRFSNYP